MCICVLVIVEGRMKVVFERLNCRVSVSMVVLLRLCVFLNMYRGLLLKVDLVKMLSRW